MGENGVEIAQGGLRDACAAAGLTYLAEGTRSGAFCLWVEENLDAAAQAVATGHFEAAGFTGVEWVSGPADAVVASIAVARDARVAAATGSAAGATMAEWEAHAARLAMIGCFDRPADAVAVQAAYDAADALAYSEVSS
jgi:hypothetical protein